MEGIIYKAIKELAIEETVADIVSTWDTMSFVVLKYYKDERRTEVVGTSSSSSRDGRILENNDQVEIGGEVPRNKSNNSDNRRDRDCDDEDGPTSAVSVPSADDNDDDDDDEEANDGGGGDEVVTTEQTADYDQHRQGKCDGESKW